MRQRMQALAFARDDWTQRGRDLGCGIGQCKRHGQARRKRIQQGARITTTYGMPSAALATWIGENVVLGHLLLTTGANRHQGCLALRNGRFGRRSIPPEFCFKPLPAISMAGLVMVRHQGLMVLGRQNHGVELPRLFGEHWLTLRLSGQAPESVLCFSGGDAHDEAKSPVK